MNIDLTPIANNAFSFLNRKTTIAAIAAGVSFIAGSTGLISPEIANSIAVALASLAVALMRGAVLDVQAGIQTIQAPQAVENIAKAVVEEAAKMIPCDDGASEVMPRGE